MQLITLIKKFKTLLADRQMPPAMSVCVAGQSQIMFYYFGLRTHARHGKCNQDIIKEVMGK